MQQRRSYAQFGGSPIGFSYSTNFAAARMHGSENRGPTICRPIGSPLFESPAGTDAASSTVRAIGPWTLPESKGSSDGTLGITPGVGRNPTTPQNATGQFDSGHSCDIAGISLHDCSPFTIPEIS